MSYIDWSVLIASLIFIVVYGIWKGRGTKDMESYFKGTNPVPWYTIGLSIMGTQASAITFLSTPGQAFDDGMRFIQIYFGLPLAMVILSVTAVPIYHRLKVYTAYEYLENRFDLKTRSLGAFLFLTQRSLAAGLSLLAPSIILSVVLGWNIFATNLMIGGLVIIYTVSGGTKTVSYTQKQQMLIIFVGLFTAAFMIIHLLPEWVSFGEAVKVAGKMGKLNVVSFKFDFNDRYNFWTGIIGGLFLSLSYFGTDQSQVARYLTGQSVTQSRLGLLFNGIVKIPMQFLILFIGVMVFVFYQFVKPPVYFNSVEKNKIYQTEYAGEFKSLEADYDKAFEKKNEVLKEMVQSENTDAFHDAATIEKLTNAEKEAKEIRGKAIDVIKKNNPAVTRDTDYIFLSFIMKYLPVGLIGLLMAAIFAASMSSTSSELNALSSTTVVDIYKRMIKKNGSEKHYLRVSQLATVFWGLFAILFAEVASKLGNLIEAVNIWGSLFYGTILGIFLVAFYLKRIRSNAVFIAAIIAEITVFAFFLLSKIPFLWFNVIGCIMVIVVSIILNLFESGKSVKKSE